MLCHGHELYACILLVTITMCVVATAHLLKREKRKTWLWHDKSWTRHSKRQIYMYITVKITKPCNIRSTRPLESPELEFKNLVIWLAVSYIPIIQLHCKMSRLIIFFSFSIFKYWSYTPDRKRHFNRNTSITLDMTAIRVSKSCLASAVYNIERYVSRSRQSTL